MPAMAGARLPLCLLMLVTQAMSQAAPCPRGMLAVYRLSLNTPRQNKIIFRFISYNGRILDLNYYNLYLDTP